MFDRLKFSHLTIIVLFSLILAACTQSNNVEPATGISTILQAPKAESRGRELVAPPPPAPTPPIPHTLAFEPYMGNGSSYPFGSWSNVTQYVNLVRTEGGNIQAAVKQTSIKTLAYVDFNSCSAYSVVSGPTPSPGTIVAGNKFYLQNPYASPDCGKFTATDFYSQGTETGSDVWTYVYPGGSYEQHIGDPSNAAARNDVINAYNSQYSGSGYNYVLLDDAYAPSETVNEFPRTFCNGLNQCSAGSPGGVANPSGSASYSDSAWQNGMKQLMISFYNDSVPAAVNGLGGLSGNTPTIVSQAVPTGQAFGGYCEDCFYGFNNGSGVQYPNYGGTLGSISTLVNNGESVIITDENSSSESVASRMTGLAGIMMVYDYRYIYEGSSGCNANASTVYVCPEITFEGWNPINSYELSSAGVQQSNGSSAQIYRRDFSNCTSLSPKTALYCTAVLNPNYYNVQITSSFTSGKGLANGNSPTELSVTAGSYCGCYGDSAGSLTAVSASSPVTLLPGQGMIFLYPVYSSSNPAPTPIRNP